MKSNKLFFFECHLAGRQYYDVDEVWDDLHVGMVLTLERERDNVHDHNAVQVILDNGIDESTGKQERYLLGYIPSSKTEKICSFLDMGWGDVFECRISKIDPDQHFENQIRLTVKILQRK